MTNNKVKKKIESDSPKVIFEDCAKPIRAFNQFWENFKNQFACTPEQNKELDDQLTKYRTETSEIDKRLSQFQEFLRLVPIASAIGHWIQGRLADPLWEEKYSTIIKQLQKKNLIPFKDPTGKFVTLEYFMQHGHQTILEEIRCIKEWSLLEKEESVQCYVRFSHSLAHQTHGLIPQGFDPDRDRVHHKAVKYEVFIDFVNHLSDRDALIAKLLYFGAPSMEELLSLTTHVIDPKSFSIQFQDLSITFPKHLICDLLSYIRNKEKKLKLVFTNVRGAEVERAHLNQSFARACEKMSSKEKITPGSLLRHENKSEN